MKNESGIHPSEFKVLIRPKDEGNTHKFKGADGKEYQLHKADETADREKFAAIEGVLIDLSPLAFTYHDGTVSSFNPPKPGDRVLYAKYAGAPVKGKDGKDYRIINDKDVCAVLS